MHLATLEGSPKEPVQFDCRPAYQEQSDVSDPTSMLLAANALARVACAQSPVHPVTAWGARLLLLAQWLQFGYRAVSRLGRPPVP
jgi:hypothetical protein